MECSLGRAKLKRLLRGAGAQTAFAKQSGVPQSQLSLYVNGNRKPGRTNALKIQTASGGRVCSADWDRPERATRKAPARVAARSTVHDKNAPQGT